jgi:hypothetical protein
MSIPVNFQTVNEQAGVASEYEFDTKPENMHILYYIARNQLYSDELTALLREYGINAMDIHIATGQAERPIRVTLPTQLDPFLKIRDFGTGLDKNGIKEYVSFGESSKRADPLQTGQLGIGCKCGFTYGDSFIINSYVNGSMSAWNAYIDPSNKGKVAEMVTCETNEPNGIEVVIPIKSGDVDKCHEKAMFFYSFVKVVPDFVNQTPCDINRMNGFRNAVPLYQGKGWRYMGSGNPYVIMGNIPYPIDAGNFTSLELRDESRQLLKGGLVVEVKLGEVDFAASRENLKYTPNTKKNLSAKLTDITNELMAQASTTFDGCKTLWEAKLLYKEVFDYYGKLHSLRNLFSKSVTFKGFNVSNDTFSCGLSSYGSDTDVICWSYSKRHRSSYGKSKIGRQQVSEIKANPKALVVENDSGICNGILNRLVGQIEAGNQYENVYLISFLNPVIKQQWLDEVGLDCPIIPLSTMPKEALSKYYPSTSSSSNGYRSSKHTSKEFIYDGDGKSRYRDNRSSFWTVTDVDLANDECVYVELDKFNYTLDNGLQHPIELKEFLVRLKDAGIDTPDTVYGFKPSSAVKARKNPKMLTLWQWFKEAITNFIEVNPQIEQQLSNWDYVNQVIDPLHENLNNFGKIVCEWDTVPSSHPLREMFGKVFKLNEYRTSQLKLLRSFARTLNTSYTKFPPTYDIALEYQAMASRYPLMFRAAKAVGNYKVVETEWQEDLKQYVTLIDAVTP